MAEIVLKLSARTTYLYFKDGWNWLDTMVVMLSLTEIIVKSMLMNGHDGLDDAVRIVRALSGS